MRPIIQLKKPTQLKRRLPNFFYSLDITKRAPLQELFLRLFVFDGNYKLFDIFKLKVICLTSENSGYELAC